MAYFAHRDWVGTWRAITNASGAISNDHSSLPFGDGGANTFGTQDNSYDGFIGLWGGDSSLTNHAPYREYWAGAGRWLQPDPYDGSYDDSNPQSLNRYAYVGNNPLVFNDPTGQFIPIVPPTACLGGPEVCAIAIGVDIGEAIIGYGIVKGLEDLFGFGGPSFHGSLQPRPQGTGNPQPDGNFGESLGIGKQINTGRWGITQALGLPDAECEFGACGGGGLDFTQPGQTDQTNSNGPQYPYLPPWLTQNRTKQGRPPGRPTPRNIPTENPGAEPQLGPTNEPPLTNSGRFWYTLMQLLRIIDNNINPPVVPIIVNPCVIDPLQPYCHKPYNGPV